MGAIPKGTIMKHTVVAGDTLTSIAKKYNLTVHDLRKLNPGQTDFLDIGQTLLVSVPLKTPIEPSKVQPQPKTKPKVQVKNDQTVPAPYVPQTLSFDEAIEFTKKTAASLGIPVSIALALITAESSWDPTANASKTGAKGIMQITPILQKGRGIKNPLDFEEAVTEGLKFLKDLKRNLQKHPNIAVWGTSEEKLWSLAAVAYHAGLAGTKAWLDRGGNREEEGDYSVGPKSLSHGDNVHQMAEKFKDEAVMNQELAKYKHHWK